MQIFTQIRDVDKLILEKLDARSVLNLCKLNNRYIQSICTDDVFQKRIQKEFPQLISLKIKNLSWKKYYIYLIYWTNKLLDEYKFLSNNLEGDPEKYYRSISFYLRRLDAKNFPLREIKQLENYYGEKIDSEEYKIAVFNDLMQYASELGFLDLAQFAIDNGANNFQGGLNAAAMVGNFRSFAFFEKYGANDYAEALEYAQDRGNTDMINFLVQKIY